VKKYFQSQFLTNKYKIKIGINAVRARSGGAHSHIVGLLQAVEPAQFRINEVHIWGNSDLLAKLPRLSWIHRHCPVCSQRSILKQLAWEKFEFPRILNELHISLLFNVDAGSLCLFKPAVTASRDMLSYEPGEMSRFGFSSQRIRLLILKYVQNRALRNADGVIFLTKYAGKVIQESCGLLPNVAYIPHGVGEEFKKVRPRIFPAGKKRIQILYVSNVAPYKHQWNVVEGVARLREKGFALKLFLVGGGGGVAMVKLEQSLSRWDPKGECVELHPFADHQKIPAYLARADLFVFASSCENMPNTLLEAMAAGLPIACSDRGPMPEILKNGGIYFDPENPNTISAALETLIRDTSQRQTLAAQAKKLASEYSWERCAENTFAFLSQTLKRNS